MSKILLIGGSNIDYIGTSKSPLIMKTSNIGSLKISYGGVMRNVVENLARLNNDCYFITAIGEDLYGNKLKNFLKNELNVKLFFPITNLPTSSYICINDSNHDMAIALNDMEIMRDLSPRFLDANKSIINEFNDIILDSNISEESLEYLFKNFPNKRFYCEGISAEKVIKFKPYLGNVFLLKCNLYEAKALFNEENDIQKLLIAIKNSGVKNCVITQGENDIYYFDNKEISKVSVEKIKKINGNTTGCGDAMFAGIIDKLLKNESLKKSIIFGEKLSVLTLQSSEAVNKNVSKLIDD